MSIFELKGNKLSKVHEKGFKLEKPLQKLTEENLEEVFNLQFVKSEIQLNSLRIDTLAFDPETKSFVIIEYKRDKSFSVIDQGYAYLALMLNNKAEFILEFNENKKDNIKREDVDWSQSRVMFIADSFTTYQRKAIEFKDLPIELWEVSLFNNNLVLFNHLKPAVTSESIKTVSRSETIQSVSREVKTYSAEDHLDGKPEKIKELFEQINENLLGLNEDITSKPVKYYIGYKLGSGQNFIDVHLFKSRINIWFLRMHKEDLKNSKNVVDVKDAVKYYGKKISMLTILEESDLDNAFDLIKQVYEFNSKLASQ